MNWKKFKEEKPPEGEEVLAYHPRWCSERFKNSIEKGKKSTN